MTTTTSEALSAVPEGGYHRLLREHAPQMSLSWLQQRVVNGAISEHETLCRREQYLMADNRKLIDDGVILRRREQFLADENRKLIAAVAGLTQRLRAKPKLVSSSNGVEKKRASRR